MPSIPPPVTTARVAADEQSPSLLVKPTISSQNKANYIMSCPWKYCGVSNGMYPPCSMSQVTQVVVGSWYPVAQQETGDGFIAIHILLGW
uniref:Uncharacterized protein n=1 Tax=Oryza brachyantha TaxID=4533 RepID=J3MMY9_ORYBR